jgi:hypothetical protein
VHHSSKPSERSRNRARPAYPQLVPVIISAHLRSSAPHLPDTATAKRELAWQGRGASLRIIPRDIDIEAACANADLVEGDMNTQQDNRRDTVAMPGVRRVREQGIDGDRGGDR